MIFPPKKYQFSIFFCDKNEIFEIGQNRGLEWSDWSENLYRTLILSNKNILDFRAKSEI